MATDPKRVALVDPIESRDQTIGFDRKMINGIVEQSLSGTRAIKRSGNRLAFTGVAGLGQGITNYLGNLYSVSGDFLNAFSSTASGLVAAQATSSAAWTKREGMMTTGFAGKLWVAGGFMQPSLAIPTFTATISAGQITGIVANTLGVGYAPGYPTTVNLIISGGGGSNGAATAAITGQSLTGPVVVTNPGSGYTTPPSVTVATTGWGVMNDVWNSADGINWTLVDSSADWPQRGRGQMIVFNNKMWVCGGITGTGANPSDIAYSDVWSSSDGLTWTRATANAWPGRWRHGLTVFNNLLWVSGGNGLVDTSGNFAVYPTTAYSDVYQSADGINWVKTVGQAPWVARSSHAFFPANNLLWVVGGQLIDAFALATGDSWSSPDGITWTRVSSNPFGVAASGAWPIAALNSAGMDYTIPPPVTVTGGSGGAAAWAFNDFDDDGDDTDLSPGPMMEVTFNNVGSGMTTAPTLSFGTSIGFNAGAYAFLNGTSNGGAKQFKVGQIGTTTYLFELADGGTFVHTIWATTDGVTYTNLNVNFGAGWPVRYGEWIAYGNLWMLGGIDTTPTYYNDVWYISLGGTSAALSPTVPLGFYHFNQTAATITSPLLVFKSTGDLYSYNASLALLTKLTASANYPATTVPGLVYLDGYFFVMDTKGRIFNSAANDPATWTALGVIAMQNEPNGGAAIAKLANYVVGFGVWTLEFFYDAATPAPASPLLPQQTLPIQVGCAAGESVIEMQNSIVWIGQTRREGQGVYMFNGYNPVRISTPFIDRLIQNDPLTNVRAYSVDIFGHSLYVLYLQNSAVTLTFDFTTQVWSLFTGMTAQGTKAVSSLSSDPYGLVTATIPAHGYSDGDPVVISGAATAGYNGSWNVNVVNANTVTYLVPAALAANPGTALAQGYTSGPFSIVASAQVTDVDYVQDPSNGQIYAQEITDYTDHGMPVDFQVVTERWDGGVSTFKFISRTSLVCDMVASNALIAASDTDYQSWSSYRTLVLNSGQRPSITPCGQSRRRAFKLRHTAATPFRGEALELEFFVGDF